MEARLAVYSATSQPWLAYQTLGERKENLLLKLAEHHWEKRASVERVMALESFKVIHVFMSWQGKNTFMIILHACFSHKYWEIHRSRCADSGRLALAACSHTLLNSTYIKCPLCTNVSYLSCWGFIHCFTAVQLLLLVSTITGVKWRKIHSTNEYERVDVGGNAPEVWFVPVFIGFSSMSWLPRL